MIGFINVDKPIGLTSAQVVAKVKKQLALDKTTKVGHTGTLDPLASGVLPIAIGKATKLFDFMLSKTKEYVAEFTFGYETDTLDSSGRVIKEIKKYPTKADIKQVLPRFVGKISQIPPQYSAKSVNGKRAYSLARSGKMVEMKPCIVAIQEFELIEQKAENVFTFKIVCGSGTYIRSLCRDLAYALGTRATMTALKRVRVGVFSIENASNLDDISQENLLPCEIVLEKLAKKEISSQVAQDLRQGKIVKLSLESEELFKTYCNGELLGLGKMEDKQFKMKIWLS
ncbi:MAG: tRNA pseudouridine(55) synthase TruB [Clostridia bacterium]|nr:tRNA pseudouridine(55) synthase TruB [Clostridia bacterium]